MTEFDGEAKKANNQLDVITARLEEAKANLKEVSMQRDIAISQVEELKQAVI